MATPWRKTSTGPSLPVSSYSMVAAESSTPLIRLASTPATEDELGIGNLGNVRAGARVGIEPPPGPLGLSHQQRVHDQVPERPDHGHVAGPEQPVWLDEDGHLAAVAAGPGPDPAEVHDPVNGAVDDLRGPLVAGQVQREKGEGSEVRAGWGLAQIRRQPVAKRRPLRTVAGVRA